MDGRTDFSQAPPSTFKALRVGGAQRSHTFRLMSQEEETPPQSLEGTSPWPAGLQSSMCCCDLEGEDKAGVPSNLFPSLGLQNWAVPGGPSTGAPPAH